MTGAGDDRDAVTTSDGVVACYRAPAADLAPFVIDYSFYDSGPAESRRRVNDYLPGPANVALTFDAGPLTARIRNRRFDWGDGAMVFGPSSHLMQVASDGGWLVGFGITALGWGRLFDTSASDVADRVVPLASLWGEQRADALHAALATTRDPDLAAAILDDGLRDALRPASRDEAVVRALTAAIQDPATEDCATIARALDLPLPQLRRIAQRHFGFGPKLLLRRTRFVRSALDCLGSDADFALDAAGYYDQSHFIRDAQGFLGKTARQFAATLTPLMAAMIAGRDARFGKPLQTLIAPGRDNVENAARPT